MQFVIFNILKSNIPLCRNIEILIFPPLLVRPSRYYFKANFRFPKLLRFCEFTISEIVSDKSEYKQINSLSRATLIQELYLAKSLYDFWKIFEVLKISSLLVRPSRSYFKANLQFLKSFPTKVSMRVRCLCLGQLKSKSCSWRWAGAIFEKFLKYWNFHHFLWDQAELSLNQIYDFWNRFRQNWVWANKLQV